MRNVSGLALPYESLRIHRALEIYLRNWHPVEWRSRIHPGLAVSDNQCLGEIFVGLSAIETDSRVIAKKIRAARLDQTDSLHEFLIVWQAEESEHGRIFEALARLYGVGREPRVRVSIGRGNAGILPVMGKTMPALMRAAYCAQGSLQEFVALQTYLYIAGIVENDEIRGVIQDVARQESRHMKFYLTCANEYLGRSRSIQQAVRVALKRLWFPPGVDLLGDAEFRRIAKPLLDDERYRLRLLQMDEFAERLPGLGGMNLMRKWLTGSG